MQDIENYAFMGGGVIVALLIIAVLVFTLWDVSHWVLDAHRDRATSPERLRRVAERQAAKVSPATRPPGVNGCTVPGCLSCLMEADTSH